MAKTEIKTTLKPNLSLVEPPLFKIIYLNDEVTSMEFVVSTLIEYFNYRNKTNFRLQGIHGKRIMFFKFIITTEEKVKDSIIKKPKCRKY